ncbi:MAG: extracellular solute-binding protein [Treponema sp.]|nr:extracellular solute-binding protein [Treponema sp.]
MKKIILTALVITLCGIPVFAGGGNEQPQQSQQQGGVIKIWVGAEAVSFYQQKVNEYITKNNFQYAITVEGVDAGAAAAKFLDDTAAGADIFSIAHDNLGRLIAGSSAIGPITDQALLRQILNDNPAIFHNVIKGTVGGTEYTFGIPYRAQSLVLYYNKKYLTDDDVKTWEGIWAKAKAAGKQSVTINGDDGYNNSFLVLATKASDHTPIADLYLNNVLTACNFNSDLAVATMHWGQRFFTDTSPDGRIFYGAKRVSDSGWEVELRNEASLSLIGGAWNYSAARAALGSNLGIAVLPNFTLTTQDVAGTNVAANTVMRSGTFADTVMFVMKKYNINDRAEAARAAAVQQILLYLSSIDIQEAAFNAIQNLPAFKNARAEFAGVRANTTEGLLARMQLEMFDRGRPQPFGANTRMNLWYYQSGAPQIVLDILTNAGNSYDTTAKIKTGMATVESIWRTGRRP